ncbi:DUF2520 domain-containing protein [Alicyclobacillaceae bacterium I2511]|nr:DUF2520 domain-containing protein [Alicyclobacillaceae bacterium I2511]
MKQQNESFIHWKGGDAVKGTVAAEFIFVGSGRVAVNLALGLRSAGHHILGALVRSVESDNARRFQQLIGPVTAIPGKSSSNTQLPNRALDWLRVADAVIITVSDTAINEIAQQLAAILPQGCHARVFHTSGSQDSSVLSPLQALGLRCASMHPLQTFAATQERAQNLSGIAFSIEGEDQAVTLATQWATQMGGSVIKVPAAQRPAYHAAAVLASNAVLALLQVATQLLPDAAKELPNNPLLPLFQAALDNVRRLGLPQSLTGPVERGDWNTVAVHLQALKSDVTAYDVYLSLAVATVELAVVKGSLSQPQAVQKRQQLQQLLHPCGSIQTVPSGGGNFAFSNDTDFPEKKGTK